MGASGLPGCANVGNWLLFQNGLTLFSSKANLLHVFPAAELPQDFCSSLCGNKKGGTVFFFYVKHYMVSELLACI